MATLTSVELAIRLADLSILCKDGFTVRGINLSPAKDGLFVGGVRRNYKSSDWYRITKITDTHTYRKALDDLLWAIEGAGGPEQLCIEEFYFGGWAQGDAYVFDICTKEPDFETALETARNREQEAFGEIEDFKYKETHYVVKRPLQEYTFLSGDTHTFKASSLEEATLLYNTQLGSTDTGVTDEALEKAYQGQDCDTVVAVDDGEWQAL
jgi:hypothetical protein